MFNNTSAAAGGNNTSPHSRASGRTRPNVTVMQASTSNNLDAQPHMAFDQMPNYVPRSNVTTGQGRGQRASNPQSSSPSRQFLASIQSSTCFAGTSDSLNCCCPSCRETGFLDPFNTLERESNPSNQIYGFGSGPASGVPSFQFSAPGIVESQPSTFGSYTPPSSASLQYNPLFNSSSTQYPYGNPSANLGSSSSQFPSAFLENGPLSIDQSFSTGLPNMTMCPANSRGPQPRVTNQPRGVPQRADRISLSWPDFLKVQGYLNAESKEVMTAERKDQLVASIGVSIAQLDFCIAARLNVKPHIEKALLSSKSLGLPTEYAVKWFQDIDPKLGPNRAHHDSAYQSDMKADRPTRKRRRILSGVNGRRTLQCTYIETNGTYCLVENIHFADWKRHEETHWPQKQWECILHGTNGNVSCHFCLGPIDLARQNTISHGPCLGRISRKGHHFHRKDKLIKHAQDSHGCAANVDTWYTDVNSDWKRQCGFCGVNFSDWDARCAHVGVHFTASSLRMVPDWRDPWFEYNEDGDKPPDDDDDDDGNDGNDNNDEDEDGYDNNRHGARNKENRNINQYRSGNDDSGSRSGYDPDTRPGSGFAKRTHQSHRGSNGRSKHHPADDMETGHSIDNIDCDQQSRQAERAQSEVQSCKQPLHIAPTKSPTSQTAIVGFEHVRHLGYGTFGEVDEVFHPGTKTYFARKSIRTSLQRSLTVLAQARREVLALCSLKHVHIVGVVAYYTLEDQFSIIMSPVAEGNLSEYMLNESAAPLTKSSNLSRWMGCLTSAVSYMHEKSWQHLDLKPSNVLVTGSHVMLSDFGGAMSVSLPEASLGNSCIVTPMYCAPELAARGPNAIIPGASDIYSLGCVFLEMVTIIHRQSLKSFQKLRSFEPGDGSYRSNSKISWIWIQHLWDIDNALGLASQNGLHILTGMLSNDPRKRPRAQDIEKSYHYYDLCRSQQPERVIETEDNLLVTIANTKDRIDPMDVARRWIARCSAKHKSCSAASSTFFPSRVLNVGTDSDFIHLQSLKKSPCPYIALSHCWGDGKILRTTTKTFRAMTQGIEISSLSTAFSQAVRITRALGLRYLWIDSLCIIQDRIDDWVSESSQMHKIYSHSSLTLCLAMDGNAAFDGNRSLPAKPEAKVDNQKCLTCTKRYNEYEHFCDDTPTTMLLDSSWSKRGWTLQERILSPRVLYYSSTRMAWECGGNRSTFDIVSQMRENLKILSFSKTTASPERHQNLPNTQNTQRFSKLWRDIVKEFSKRHLTLPQDKLPALAGVASKIASLSGQQYLAGLWSHDLIHSLLWCRDFATTPLPPPAQYRAPSWSWAAIDSPVTWSKAILDDFPDDEGAKILDFSVTAEYEKSPFGSVAPGGYVEICGSMKKVLIKRNQSHNVLDVESRIPFAFAQWDCLDPHYHGKSHSDSADGSHELWCLSISVGAGLLLREMKKSAPDTFQRVGVFRILENRSGESVWNGSRRGDVRSIVII